MQQNREIARFRRRVQTAIALGAFADALACTALAAAAGLLVGRLFGVWPAPRPLWLLALLPPVAWTFWRVARRGFSRAASAAHLDRRLGLEGLLVTGLERDTQAWQSQLDARLALARARLPRVRGRRLLVRGLAPLALLAGVLALPAPAVVAPRHDPAKRQALADLDQQIELLEQAGVLDEQRRDELRERADDLEAGLQRGDGVEWSDLDAMAAELAHAQTLQVASLEEARAALAELAREAGEQARAGGDASAAEELAQQLADRLAKARDAGLLQGLPPELAAQLAELAAGDVTGGFDPAALPQDAAALAELARAMLEAMEGDAQRLAAAELLAAGELADLDALLAGMASETGLLAESPGKGGVDRGRADAALPYAQDTQGDTADLEAQRLPPGRTISREWSVLGVQRASPAVDPQRAGGAGGAAGAGTGEATWRRRLAPSHRDVVRRFFSQPNK